ncbi:S-adenosylmethionine decarboxylase [Komagataella phaffii CBS 7435]|uniref:S-adenosylmethionine decarboxylase proenzyme n=2 Tax=Komagataella phaffii TaxID=460519 RepID=C4QZY6_KOMPG|nr:S-adenosylmethionine decarboxylase, required for the biosynthesis of spermidine and spermine [Komagataella phaffii GS115]AOA63138.1 GQ67_00230T0 [Komagataella phaffii]CAH2448690.1 S-adenosylmethionine decarboxylase [Komagataella phaffii CBS 7435]AOA67100.1 GQ68_01158T0 [Komagataella phaffii GS115]CAY68810.1 S-adenosylmethionine decarboxylase, required for the biosynthesis of spermidine and spermine [Komagataella phaffii GS115]CCA38782.1 S-adenosylmethionine decarboxylase [Komagataella phaff
MTLHSVAVPDFINHELSTTLDSTNAFEGPEKLLEIWFAGSAEEMEDDGLRQIPLEDIESLLELVNCEILSKISSSSFDSYLLSESSLFVYPHKLILKTCGTTTTLNCFDKLFDLMKTHLQWDLSSRSPYRIFYSRRSFMFPSQQKHVHQSWQSEVEWLNKYFGKSSSKVYIVGDLSNDHWYLYLNGTDGSHMPSPPSSPNDFKGKDETFELLMTELDPVKCERFMTDIRVDQFSDVNLDIDDYGHVIGMKTLKETGIDSFFSKERSKHDAFAFKPCGFSSNSIVDKDYYYTIHITPEEAFSYASFETNYPKLADKTQLINQILSFLNPGKFVMVFVQEVDEDEVLSNDFMNLKRFNLEGYTKVDNIIYDLKFNYKLIYSQFEKIKQ